mmetsp:Transcript_646/g.933  ORF Transcript_646/g.933 Transcript_646/m.933 type:complete len:298 (+) Transcript_646:289-1182(+)|eukprot:CAMPEP_0185262948 /NCGR_PEP_ID=MMETSP1359-20130426/10956_1 /TAXON_ID=552665 /ORGANISM="Bigelowiella longifila, Strain CCMP242" /LENGTH=297 /DNA_ID=CAMNT_0027850021 /DNA_START=282 /DNA_END=1175 /DNA_ORIENTATION=+
MPIPSALKKISSLRKPNVMRLCTTSIRNRFLRRLCNFAQRQSRNKFSSEAQGLGVGSPAVSSSSSSFMRWAPRSVWGLYAVVTTTGVYLLASDIYRVWELSTRVDELKDDQTSAAEDRLDFVQGSSTTNVPSAYISSSFSNIATLQQLLPSRSISLKGSYSDLPGKRFFYLSKGNMRYDLRFGQVEEVVGRNEGGEKELMCHFEGKGQDAEGVFTVEGGICNLTNGRLAWGERSRPQPVRYLFSQEDFTLFAECRAELQLDMRESDELSLKGWYEANTGRSGELRLKSIAEAVKQQR